MSYGLTIRDIPFSQQHNSEHDHPQHENTYVNSFPYSNSGCWAICGDVWSFHESQYPKDDVQQKGGYGIQAKRFVQSGSPKAHEEPHEDVCYNSPRDMQCIRECWLVAAYMHGRPVEIKDTVSDDQSAYDTKRATILGGF